MTITRLLLTVALATMASTAYAYRIETRITTSQPVLVAQSVNESEVRVLERGEPVVVEFPSSDGRILRTEFAGINSDSGAPLVKVFVNNPDANADTPVSDSGYVGTIAFYPVPLDGTFRSTLNLERIVGQASDDRNVSVTYALAGNDDATVSITDSTLSTE